MPLSIDDENGMLDGINAAATDRRLSLIRAINRETGDGALLLCCTFNHGRKTQIVPIAEIIVGKDLDVYQFPEEVRELISGPQPSGDIEVGIPGFDTL